MIVDTDAFLSAMRSKWSEYGNVYADAPLHTWLQIATTLNYQASAEREARWPVIPAELGIGKTTAAKLWCAMLPDGHSALVVVRTREQAREVADDINAWSGERKAVALYSPSDEWPNEYWHDPDATKIFPVV